MRGNPAKSHRLAKLGAGAGILAAEGGLHVVAADVEPRYRCALAVHNPRVDIRAQAPARAERPRHHGNGISPPRRHRAPARLGTFRRTAPDAVVSTTALAEVIVTAARSIDAEAPARPLNHLRSIADMTTQHSHQ